MAEAPPAPPFPGSQNAVPTTPPGQSPALGLPPPPFPPIQGVRGAPPRASVTAPLKSPFIGPPGSFASSRQPPGPLPTASTTPARIKLFHLPPASAAPSGQPPGPFPRASTTPARINLFPLPRALARPSGQPPGPLPGALAAPTLPHPSSLPPASATPTPVPLFPLSPAAATPNQQPPSPLSGAPATPTLQHPDFLPPASETPTQQPRGPPPETWDPPPREALGVETPNEYATPAAPTATASSQQQQEGVGSVPTVRGVPTESPIKEYLLAVKAYEQQVGPNILRGKMYIESLPAYAVPPEERLSTWTVAQEMAPRMAPETECGYNMAMGVGPGQPCGYGRGMTKAGRYGEAGRPMAAGYDVDRPMDGGYEAVGRPMSGRNGQAMAPERRSTATSLAAQRRQETFEDFGEMGTALNLAELVEMWPQVKRLMAMGGCLEEIINLPRNYEGPMAPPGSGYAGPPIWGRGSFERPMNVPGGFVKQPMPGYDKPMRLPPDYGGPIDRYDRPQDRYDRSAHSYDGPPPNARYYGRGAFCGENSRSIREDYENPRRASSKKPPQKRSSDLLRKIRQDIEEHFADSMFQQIHGEVVGYETEKVRRVKGGSLSESRSTSPRSFSEDDGESRRAWRTSSPTGRFRDDTDVQKRSPSPRKQPSRRRKESSSSCSSSSGSESRSSRTPRRRKDVSTKSLKSRSKRRSKSKKERSSFSSSSSSSRC